MRDMRVEAVTELEVVRAHTQKPGYNRNHLDNYPPQILHSPHFPPVVASKEDLEFAIFPCFVGWYTLFLAVGIPNLVVIDMYPGNSAWKDMVVFGFGRM